MPKVFFDARFIRLDYHDGISRFSVELIHELSKKLTLTAIIHDEAQRVHLPAGVDSVLLNSPESPTELLIARRLNRLGAEVVYSPMQIMGSWGRKYKLVLTLHDLIYYRHRKPPTDLNFLVKAIWWLYHLSYVPQRILLNRADLVVTVSETTKKLIEKHHLTKRPIAVVYNGVKQMANKARSYPSSKDLLYIGSFMPYKNVETLLTGVAQTTGFTLHLLSKITKKREKELSDQAKRVGASVVFHRGVTDEQYQDLLKNCFALVTASKDEGFGIPVVEALAVGTPVIISDLDVFKEIAGEAGLYFNPSNAVELAEQIQQLANKTQWEEHSAGALNQSKKYSWRESAIKLAELINNLR